MFNGIPQVIMALHGRVFVWLVPLKVVLNEGVKPTDMLQWFDALSVTDMARVRKNTSWHEMKLGVVAWVPPGHVPFVFFHHSRTNEDDATVNGVVLVQPWLSPNMAQNLYDTELLEAGRDVLVQSLTGLSLDPACWGAHYLGKLTDFLEDASHYVQNKDRDSRTMPPPGPVATSPPVTPSVAPKMSPATTDLGTPAGHDLQSAKTTTDGEDTPRLDYNGRNPMAQDEDMLPQGKNLGEELKAEAKQKEEVKPDIDEDKDAENKGVGEKAGQTEADAQSPGHDVSLPTK